MVGVISRALFLRCGGERQASAHSRVTSLLDDMRLLFGLGSSCAMLAGSSWLSGR
jgi:hypothetical protein